MPVKVRWQQLSSLCWKFQPCYCCPCFGRRRKSLVDIPNKETYLGQLVEGLCCQDEENVWYDGMIQTYFLLTPWQHNNLTRSPESIIAHAPPTLTIFCILPPVFLIVQNFHEINFIYLPKDSFVRWFCNGISTFYSKVNIKSVALLHASSKFTNWPNKTTKITVHQITDKTRYFSRI